MTSDLNPTDLIIVSDDDSGHGVEVHIPDTPQSDDLKYQVQKELEKLDSSLDSAMDAVLMTLNINPQQSKDTDLTSGTICYFSGGFVLPKDTDLTSRPLCYFSGGFVLPGLPVSCRCQQSLARGEGEPVQGERDEVHNE